MQTVTTSTHTLICGCGILGLTVARELVSRGYEDIVILEKESSVGKHASGRNSGILHAGIYYTPETAKAKHCLDGNFRMRKYCEEHDLPLFKSGKVVVTTSVDQHEALHELHKRAQQNGAKVELIDKKQLAEIEPNAKTTDQALFSHYTATVDPKKILACLENELISSGKIKILFNTAYQNTNTRNEAITSQGTISYKQLINVAGSYSDKVAHTFGIGLNYKLIPFKGVYRQLKPHKRSMVNGNIYPVPNIKNPFLGVHFSKSVTGDVYLGPTAIPAFGRENYGILKGLDSESFEIMLRDLALFFQNKKFRAIALEEPKKYIFKYFFNDAKKLVKELSPEDIMQCPKVGIRPQLINLDTKELVMDFLIEKGENSLHVLNSISPAFTSSMSFAKLIADRLED
nr:L-2-hydroxyglutarate oxidase [Desulfobulbaceae bacterium]